MSSNLKELYCEVKKYIEMIDFSKLWNGFNPFKFALYNENECFYDGNYIEKTPEFLANTAISYNGEIIAIWNVQSEYDPIILTSKLVHEMFHGFQMANNESRFFDDLDSLYNYKYDENNLGLKLRENQLIYQLVDNFDEDKFNELLKIRKYRFNNFQYEYHYESSIEQIEGSANYVELSCLKQLSGELFNRKLTTIKESIINANNMLPIRVISYDIGALLLLIMCENNIKFDNSFSKITFSENILLDIKEEKYIVDTSIKEVIENYFLKADNIINEAIKKNDVVTNIPSEILGVNIYNAIYYNNHMVSTYFVMYGLKDDKKIEYGNFVIETKEYKKLTKIYRI